MRSINHGIADVENVKQSIAQAAVEAAKAVVIVINEKSQRCIMSTEHKSASENTRHRIEPSPRQLIFKCNAKDKYTELKNLEMEVTNILVIKHYEINDTEKVAIIKIG